VASQVFLHIGLPKTGTTYLQSVLWDAKAASTSNRIIAGISSNRPIAMSSLR